MIRLTPRLHQKSELPRPALIAPGTSRMNALSTISITEIDAVSDANATESARRNGTPARSTGPIVSEEPNKRQGDGEHDRLEFAPAPPGREDHAEDFTNRTAVRQYTVA